MLSICNAADMARALSLSLDPTLADLLACRRDQLLDGDFGELVHLIVVEPGDDLASIEAAAGVPLATNLIDGSRYGEPDFVPSFEWIMRHGRWLEAVLILTDDGFATVLLVPDRGDVDDTLLRLLREHA